MPKPCAQGNDVRPASFRLMPHAPFHPCHFLTTPSQARSTLRIHKTGRRTRLGATPPAAQTNRTLRRVLEYLPQSTLTDSARQGTTMRPPPPCRKAGTTPPARPAKHDSLLRVERFLTAHNPSRAKAGKRESRKNSTKTHAK